MQGTLDLVAVGAIVLGLVQCFFGYRILKIILGITGFILGGLIAGYLAFGLTQSQLFAIIAGVIGGLIGGGLAAGLYVVGVFLIGALFGGMAASTLLALGGGTPQGWVVAILAIAAGILAVILQRPMLIVVTSFLGAWWAVTGIAALAGAIELGGFQAVPANLMKVGAGWLIGSIVLGVAGLLVQFRGSTR
jgi:hypothetical protein